VNLYTPPHVCIGDIKKSLPAAALAAVRTAAFAACLVLGLASCKMDMDDSAGGGRLAFYIDRATAYNLNSAGGRIIDGSGDGARRV